MAGVYGGVYGDVYGKVYGGTVGITIFWNTDKFATSPIGEGRTTQELTYVFRDSWPEGEWT